MQSSSLNQYRPNDYQPSITKRSLAPAVGENQSEQEKAVFQFLMQTKPTTPNIIADSKSMGSDTMIFEDSKESIKNTGRIQTSPSKHRLRTNASPNKPYVSGNMLSNGTRVITQNISPKPNMRTLALNKQSRSNATAQQS